MVTYKVVTMSSRTGDIPADMLRSSTLEMQSLDDLAQEIQLREESTQKIYALGKSYDTVSGRIVMMTEKAKEGEKGVQPSGLEVFQKMEPRKGLPVMTEYEVLEAIADEKSKRAPEGHPPKRRQSESLAPIQEAESRRQSPEEDPALHGGPGGVRRGHAEHAPQGEALNVGLFGPRRKSLSEWRYSQEPAVSVTTAHYLTQSAASRVVVTSAFRSAAVPDASMTFLRPCPPTPNLPVYLAVWLYVQGSQPKLFPFVRGSVDTAVQQLKTRFHLISSAPFPRCDSAAVACNEGGKNDPLKPAPP